MILYWDYYLIYFKLKCWQVSEKGLSLKYPNFVDGCFVVSIHNMMASWHGMRTFYHCWISLVHTCAWFFSSCQSLHWKMMTWSWSLLMISMMELMIWMMIKDLIQWRNDAEMICTMTEHPIFPCWPGHELGNCCWYFAIYFLESEYEVFLWMGCDFKRKC